MLHPDDRPCEMVAPFKPPIRWLIAEGFIDVRFVPQNDDQGVMHVRYDKGIPVQLKAGVNQTGNLVLMYPDGTGVTELLPTDVPWADPE